MQSKYISFWRNSKHSRFVLFKKTPLEIFLQYAQKSPDSTEAGGILLGEIHKLGFIVTLATKPQPTDLQKRTYFERSVLGHQEVANFQSKKTLGRTVYLGEWHTHYEKDPLPSCLDIYEWKKLASLKNIQPLLTVIVGTEQLHVETVTLAEQELFFPV